MDFAKGKLPEFIDNLALLIANSDIIDGDVFIVIVFHKSIINGEIF